MLLSAEKGVTNDGTIVHYKSEATGTEKEKTEQLFTARRKTEKKGDRPRLKARENGERDRGIKDKDEKAKGGIACPLHTLGNMFRHSHETRNDKLPVFVI